MERSVRRHLPRSGWLTIAALALACASVAALQAQQGQLQLFVSAVDGEGKPVTDLKPEEIAMSENGAPGKVLTLERFNRPIKLTIGIDNGAESSNALSHYRSGLTGLVEALPLDVEVTLIATAPQPRMVVRPTTDRAEILRGITRFAPDDQPARFTDTLVEYAERLEKDFKSEKLNYSPVLIMVSTTAAEVANSQLDTTNRALQTVVGRGGRVLVAMTTTRAGDANQFQELNNGRQALIAIPLTKASRGKFEALATSIRLATLLPEWGKELADSHTKQVNQYRVVIERPGGATGPLANLDIRLTRPNLSGKVSGDGRFIP